MEKTAVSSSLTAAATALSSPASMVSCKPFSAAAWPAFADGELPAPPPFRSAAGDDPRWTQTPCTLPTPATTLSAASIWPQARSATAAGTGAQGRYDTLGGPGPQTRASTLPGTFWPSTAPIYIAMAGQHQLWQYDPAITDKLGIFAGSGREELVDGSVRRGRAESAQRSGHRRRHAVSSSPTARPAPFASPGLGGGTARLDHHCRHRPFRFRRCRRHVAMSVRLQHPLGVVYHEGFLYIADTYNHKIRLHRPGKQRKRRTFLGSGEDGWRDGGDPLFDEPGGSEHRRRQTIHRRYQQSQYSRHRPANRRHQAHWYLSTRKDCLTRATGKPAVHRKNDHSGQAQTVAAGETEPSALDRNGCRTGTSSTI